MAPGDSRPCPACSPGGRQARCRLCCGSGAVPRTFHELYIAHRNALALAPDWRGADDSLRPGSPTFSLAAYYRRRRYLRGRAAVARGRLNGDLQVVALLDGAGRELACLHGLAWGGEGQNQIALAIVLADALPRLFPSVEAARRFVARLDPQQPWTAT